MKSSKLIKEIWDICQDLDNEGDKRMKELIYQRNINIIVAAWRKNCKR